MLSDLRKDYTRNGSVEPTGIVVQQVARNPFEVLVNRNKHLTKKIFDYNVADALMTALLGTRDYSQLMRVAADAVRIGDVWIQNNKLYIPYYVHTDIVRDALYVEGSWDWIASWNERFARIAMDEHNIRKLLDVMQCMETIAHEHKIDVYDMLDATDLESQDLVWYRHDTLEIGFKVG